MTALPSPHPKSKFLAAITLCCLGFLILTSCKLDIKEDPDSSEVTAESTDPVQLKLAEWRELFESLKGDKDAYGKAAYRFGSDVSIPPRESLEFGKEFFEGGSWVGHFVRQFSRAQKIDNNYAMALAHEWQDDKSTLAVNTSIAIEAGKQTPLKGLKWASEFKDERIRYFAFQYVRKGFIDTLATRSFSEVDLFLRKFATVESVSVQQLRSTRSISFRALKEHQEFDQKQVASLRNWFDDQISKKTEQLPNE